MPKASEWSVEDTEKLKRLLAEGEHDTERLAAYFPGRTPHSIRCKRYILGNPDKVALAKLSRRDKPSRFGENPFFVPPCFRPGVGEK